MPKVIFTYDQRVTQTFRASCEIPAEVIAEGDEAVMDYLDGNYDQWNDDTGESTNTEYGDRCGRDTWIIEGEEDAE